MWLLFGAAAAIGAEIALMFYLVDHAPLECPICHGLTRDYLICEHCRADLQAEMSRNVGQWTPEDMNVASEEVSLREVLADQAHASRAGWMGYLFSKGTFRDDGTWTMPAEAVERWKQELATPYVALPESEKESDRREADQYLMRIVGMAR